MSHRLSYADAVKILGGSGPLAKAVDNLLGGALTVATAGGSDFAISLFDAKTEVVRLGGLITAKISDAVRGLGRHDRSERLQAAHTVLVLTAFFEELDECLATAGLHRPDFTRNDQLEFAAGRGEGTLVEHFLRAPVPLPAPDLPYASLLTALGHWFADQANRMGDHLTGLAVWDHADERARRAMADLLDRRLPDAAVARFDEIHRRLAEEIPEFAVRDTEARESARTLALRLGPSNDDDLLRSLLGFTPLTARATVLPFIAGLLDGFDRERIRIWLIGRTSQAVTRPQYAESRYRPVDKRIDHWMATYSFNLLLLTLACGGELRASDLFTRTDDPAAWLRNSALQWQAAVDPVHRRVRP
ncbi:hypothetical protein Vqi01_58010 [Micromonospora qiuiae]|uniref:NACHT N-terminal Helical domain-containing protein n=1 Tax=Micromonospora qiuiae TaxID=502268 RepID=A0ABQ4JM14_9ACTN|nr:hypothetical protein [Micromonospora qiuiae]GIJ30639.1 hypothetical protein Vqi01_58010 [Micromonospora qiuiae]